MLPPFFLLLQVSLLVNHVENNISFHIIKVDQMHGLYSCLTKRIIEFNGTLYPEFYQVD